MYAALLASFPENCQKGDSGKEQNRECNFVEEWEREKMHILNKIEDCMGKTSRLNVLMPSLH